MSREEKKKQSIDLEYRDMDIYGWKIPCTASLSVCCFPIYSYIFDEQVSCDNKSQHHRIAHQ